MIICEALRNPDNPDSPDNAFPIRDALLGFCSASSDEMYTRQCLAAALYRSKLTANSPNNPNSRDSACVTGEDRSDDIDNNAHVNSELDPVVWNQLCSFWRACAELIRSSVDKIWGRLAVNTQRLLTPDEWKLWLGLLALIALIHSSIQTPSSRMFITLITLYICDIYTGRWGLNNQSFQGYPGQGLYSLHSSINHSCRPNVAIELEPPQALTVRACSITYIHTYTHTHSCMY